MSTLEEILKIGTLYGSRAWNFHTDDSDYDVIILQKDFANLELDGEKLKFVEGSSKSRSEQSPLGNDGNAYITLETGELINFLIYENEDDSYYHAIVSSIPIVRNYVTDRQLSRVYKKTIHSFAEQTVSVLIYNTKHNQ